MKAWHGLGISGNANLLMIKISPFFQIRNRKYCQLYDTSHLNGLLGTGPGKKFRMITNKHLKPENYNQWEKDSKMYSEIKKCRICDNITCNGTLPGRTVPTGVFPKNPSDSVTSGPLDLVWCPPCGLLQLKQSYNLDEITGDNYGYRSGLNVSMVRHLTNKIRTLENIVSLSDRDIVVDIGSNDATSLKAYNAPCRRVGIDPQGIKFRQYYTDDIELIPDFFSKKLFMEKYPGERPKSSPPSRCSTISRIRGRLSGISRRSYPTMGSGISNRVTCHHAQVERLRYDLSRTPRILFI